MENNSTKITRGTKELIKLAIDSCVPEDRNNRYKICEKFCEIVEERYGGSNLDYQLKRMDTETTVPILEKIDIYFYKYHKQTS